MDSVFDEYKTKLSQYRRKVYQYLRQSHRMKINGSREQSFTRALCKNAIFCLNNDKNLQINAGCTDLNYTCYWLFDKTTLTGPMKSIKPLSHHRYCTLLVS